MLIELGNASVFRDLDEPSLIAITHFSKFINLMDGEILISEKEPKSDDIFVLCSGQVEIVSNGSNMTSGEVSLSKNDKDIFGEVGWLCNGRRTATVRAIGDVEAICIDGQHLKTFLFDHPHTGVKFLFNISKTLAERLDTTNGLLKQLLWNTGY